jgi:transposase-like protein
MRYRNENWLREQYLEERLSMSDIAERCGVVKSTIRDWMDKFDIERRDSGETLHLNSTEEVTCVNCGSDFRKEQSQINRGMDKHFCDNTCKSEYMVETQSGESNNNWKGVGDHSWRQSSQWRQTRSDVISRDDGICQSCGCSENLHVHHITPVHAGGKRYDIENLTTLCETCHMDIHSGGSE